MVFSIIRGNTICKKSPAGSGLTPMGLRVIACYALTGRHNLSASATSLSRCSSGLRFLFSLSRGLELRVSLSLAFFRLRQGYAETSRPHRPLPCLGVGRQAEDGTTCLLSDVPCGTLEFRGHSPAGWTTALQGLVLRAFRARALSEAHAALIPRQPVSAKQASEARRGDGRRQTQYFVDCKL